MAAGSSSSKFHAMLGRALIDDAYREQLMNANTRADALKAEGIDPTPEVLGAVKDSMAALDRLSRAVDGMRPAAT